jgi:GT2 family glycosyltransferase/phosphatidylglycerophosphate synthase
MLVHLLVLNYNGCRLLAECLPSVLEAARSSRYRCEVTVIDNDSSDDSLDLLARRFPEVRVERRPNRGLCSFNDVVAELPGRVAFLLNNDIKLHPDCIDPLVDPLVGLGEDTACFMTAPRSYQFDGTTYEGFKTAVAWRFGLVEATSFFRGYEAQWEQPGLTASAGAAMVVDCRKFVALGGFDPLYLPGRLEDLDFAYRAHQAGYHARYVPESVVYHLGMASFGPAFGRRGCDHLALRNTLLFQWKNLRHPLHVARQLVGLPLRLLYDACRAVWTAPGERWAFAHALWEALRRWGQLRRSPYRARHDQRREWYFFQRFHPRQIREAGLECRISAVPVSGAASRKTVVLRAAQDRDCPRTEDDLRCAPNDHTPRPNGTPSLAAEVGKAPVTPAALRQGVRMAEDEDARHGESAYPISRWYLRPAAAWLAAVLAPTRVRPNGVTLAGLIATAVAATVLSLRPDHTFWAAGWVLLAWFCDRTDGQLARLQHSVSPWGAWLDANVDELADLGLHAAVAWAAAAATASTWPWALLIAFLAGKYLLMYGLGSEEHFTALARHEGAAIDRAGPLSWIGRLYHLPGNADVRIHLLLVALCTGWLTAELALVALYYNLRWIVRYVLVARRLGGVR